jgi:hypothetical protein
MVIGPKKYIHDKGIESEKLIFHIIIMLLG